MKSLTRRRFLHWLQNAGLGCLGLAWLTGCGQDSPPEIPGSARTPGPQPANTPGQPKPLSDAAIVATLVRLAPVLAEHPVEPTPYTRYFDWRLHNLSAMRDPYTAVARSLNQVAAARFQRDFSALHTAQARALVEEYYPGVLTPPSASPLPPEAVEQFAEHVRKPIIQLYLRTEAWIQVGYGGWPGQPRDLQAYRRPAPGGKVSG